MRDEVDDTVVVRGRGQVVEELVGDPCGLAGPPGDRARGEGAGQAGPVTGVVGAVQRDEGRPVLRPGGPSARRRVGHGEGAGGQDLAGHVVVDGHERPREGARGEGTVTAELGPRLVPAPGVRPVVGEHRVGHPGAGPPPHGAADDAVRGGPPAPEVVHRSPERTNALTTWRCRTR
ncbi:hypothetical protein [Actinomycetospora chiangmaiensis]|uniref:hypothetical protein n=1 Tax=Actinomycetospora chiangmaiensis TaxID=402650 RepID=UPI00038045EE|nr:hypothetical protein [Actinomycetospora chiangmaiensis]